MVLLILLLLFDLVIDYPVVVVVPSPVDCPSLVWFFWFAVWILPHTHTPCLTHHTTPHTLPRTPTPLLPYVPMCHTRILHTHTPPPPPPPTCILLTWLVATRSYTCLLVWFDVLLCCDMRWLLRYVVDLVV